MEMRIGEVNLKIGVGSAIATLHYLPCNAFVKKIGGQANSKGSKLPLTDRKEVA